VSDESGYFQERRHLLRYRECWEQGLPIGSGRIEGGIRFVGKDRLDRTGMRWGEPGAELVLQLRCLDASQRWDGYFHAQAGARQRRFQEARFEARFGWLEAA